MVDWLILVCIILIAAGLVYANVYLLAWYSHPEDKGSCIGIALKIIVIIGLTLSWAQVLLVPLDVSNSRDTFGGGLDMRAFWYTIYIMTAVYIFIIYPFATSVYESDSEWTFCQKFGHSLCCFFCILFIVALLTIILYFTIGDAKIPVQIIYNFPTFSKSNESLLEEYIIIKSEEKKLIIDVNFFIYIIAVMSFISWFSFAIFGGIGLAAIPFDCFYDFCTRPKYMQKEEILKRQNILISDLQELKALSTKVKELEEKGNDKKFVFTSERREFDKKKHELAVGTMLAEKEYDLLNFHNEIRNENSCALFCYYLLIPIGIISLIITILWIIQYVLTFFTKKPIAKFLSKMFIFFQDHNVSFLAFLFFSIFCLYLLWATIKGNVKFGVRILFCWTIHPMKKDNTYMNSFLFNVTLILLSSISITQFCSAAFPDYVTFSDIDVIFNVLITHLKFFEIFYKYRIFQYLFGGVFLISLVYLICRRHDRVSVETLYEKKKKENDV